MANGTVVVWQLEGAKQVAEFRADLVTSAMFSPDGRRVAAVSTDGTSRAWDVSTGEEIMRAEFGEKPESFGFTKDGQFLALGGQSLVELRPLRPGDSAKRACSYLSRNLRPDERNQYLPDIPYHKTCPNLP